MTETISYTGVPFQPLLSTSQFPLMAIAFTLTGLVSTACFSLLNKSSLVRELGLALVSSLMLAFAVLFTFMSSGIYV
ncbi:hypothetical protein H4R35_005457 [Dimargaris xerosporica]|nr:hypothetical protein H4R35_005457 [Dimargaris xerosporica]